MTLIRTNVIDSKRNFRGAVDVRPMGTPRANILFQIPGTFGSGLNSVCYIDPQTHAWAWGNNDSGQLGQGSNLNNASSPVSVVGGMQFSQISGGFYHSLALDFNGYAWSWGLNDTGQLGINVAGSRSSPVSVVGGKQFTQIRGAFYHSLALDASGYAWVWGDNQYGQLGQGTTLANCSSPVSVVGGKQFTQIAGGYYHSLALDMKGYAWAWGFNGDGQLGINVAGDTSSPVSVVGGKQFSQIVAGTAFSFALDLNGYAWTWGNNADGQLGINVAGSRSSPTSVVGGKQFVQISAGYYHCLALDANGYAWAWGRNTQGQLGQGSNLNNASSPVSVVGGKQFVQIATGLRALDVRGVMWAWGDNTYGQLGINVAGSRSSPVMVVRLFS